MLQFARLLLLLLLLFASLSSIICGIPSSVDSIPDGNWIVLSVGGGGGGGEGEEEEEEDRSRTFSIMR